jgi:hypothetical protein
MVLSTHSGKCFESEFGGWESWIFMNGVDLGEMLWIESFWSSFGFEFLRSDEMCGLESELRVRSDGWLLMLMR